MNQDPIKFLIVDDKLENLVAMEALLRRDGLEVLMACSGSDALEQLLVHDIALAILDVQMPNMNGFELAELMRGAERTKHVPIIFVTAGARDPERAFQGYATGAVDFLYKPVDPQTLRVKADVFFQLYRQRRELADSLRLNELFVGILGHDLRNPLSAMLTGARLLEAGVSDEKQLRTLHRMLAAGQRMTDMIEQLLDLTRARLAGGLGFVRNRKRIDICSIVQRTSEELRVAYPERAIVVEPASDCLTAGDSDRLLQLFSNLIANAVQHGTVGSPVRVCVIANAVDVEVRVSNAGAIPASILPNIFDPFKGRQSGLLNSTGLGLGLFISQQIAIAHGGGVTVESSVDNGTTFTVRIPKRFAGAKAGRQLESARVMIVEDDDSIRESLQDAFEEEGYSVITASNGHEALELLTAAREYPEVMVLDLMMPVFDGARLYQVMKANPDLSAIKVVVSTANPERAPTGVIVVPKPLDLNRLLDTVAALCGNT